MRILLALLFSQCCYGQFKNSPEKNMINIETGMFHRGLIGCSYNRFLIETEHLYLKSGGGLGFGAAPFGRSLNQFYYLTASVGVGGKLAGQSMYLGVGIDYKYLNYFIGEYNEVSTYYDRIHYNGISLNPMVIFTFVVDDEVWVHMHSAPLYGKKNGERHEISWGAAVSVGFKF